LNERLNLYDFSFSEHKFSAKIAACEFFLTKKLEKNLPVKKKCRTFAPLFAKKQAESVTDSDL